MHDLWQAVDSLIADLLIPAGDALDHALAASEAAGLPSLHVSAAQGKLLHLLAKIQRAKTILEIGTLAGYSTIWLARALPPDGRLVTIEADEKHAEVAQRNLQHAGLADLVEIRVGLALDVLPRLAAEGAAPFDLVFIDADKPNNPEYFSWALRLARAGSVIVVDNVVREGNILNPAADEAAAGSRRLLEHLGAEPRVTATAIQTVGPKGHDGFAIALVEEARRDREDQRTSP